MDRMLDNLRSEIGLIAENCGEELSLAKILAEKDFTAKTEKIWESETNRDNVMILYKYTIDNSTKYCAEIWVPGAMDRINTYTYIFANEPTKERILLAHLIQSVKAKMGIDNVAKGTKPHTIDGKR